MHKTVLGNDLSRGMVDGSEMMDGMIPIEEARAIAYGLDLEALARRVWRAACPEHGQERNAAAVLDLTHGAIRVLTWRNGRTDLFPRECVVLAGTTDLAHERPWRSLSGTARLAPSVEVVEEEVARRAAGESLCWSSIEEQLRRAYAVAR